MNLFSRWLALSAAALISTFVAAPATAQNAPAVGIVVMHGKGGRPERYVNLLAEGLERKGYMVANLEMPWSGRRNYDVDVAAAIEQVTTALNELRSKGAKKVFVAGHSQGGAFALHYASRQPLDGVIAIAPGGSVDTQPFRQNLGSAVDRARKLVAEGKGNERGEFLDFESSRGINTVYTTAAIYLDWFDPDGAMNQGKSSRALPAALPVLYIVPRNDYPGLRRLKDAMYGALPPNPLTKLYEPDIDHLNAPRGSIDEIARWTAEVAAR